MLTLNKITETSPTLQVLISAMEYEHCTSCNWLLNDARNCETQQ